MASDLLFIGMKEKVLIIGNGMASVRLCEKLLEKDKFSITVFGEEKFPAYDRVQLTKYFESRNPENLFLKPKEWYKENGILLKTNTKIDRIDRQVKEVIDSKGNRYQYDILVLATGSSPFVPPIKGVEEQGVFVYRTIEDLEHIYEYAKKRKSGAVLGGGLLGLEAAKALVDMGLKASIIEFAPRLMPRQLDARASFFLRKRQKIFVKREIYYH